MSFRTLHAIVYYTTTASTREKPKNLLTDRVQGAFCTFYALAQKLDTLLPVGRPRHKVRG